jgi:hypothetical protein
MRVHKPKRRQGRSDRRFRPGPLSNGRQLEPGLELERRVLLSARTVAVTTARHAHEHAAATATSTASRVPPATEITDQYSAFLNDFATIEQLYVTAVNEQSSSTVTVTATVTAAYTSGGSSIQVNDASAFFPSGTTTPMTATATQGSFPIGSFYLTGFSGNTLFVNPTASSPVNLNPGTILTATVTISGQTSAASIFPSFITSRTNQMAIDLVQYFNSLPLKLPYFNAPPHTPNNRGAIQNYVYKSVAGVSTTSQSSSGTGAQGIEALPGIGVTSLQQMLLAIPLPTTEGSDLQIYNATVTSAIQQSLTQILNGVAEVYAGHIRVSAPSPNNRYGVTETGTVPSYILAQP